MEGEGEGDLADLYRRFVPDAIRMAYLMTGDRVLAEDLAQEAFVRLTGRFGHLRNRDAFPAYLRRTLVNLVRNHFRHQKVERSYLDAHGPEMATEAMLPDIASEEIIRSALLALPFRQRAALVLSYYEDLPEQRIAELLSCRPGTVKSLLSRGVAALRGMVAAQMEAERDG